MLVAMILGMSLLATLMPAAPVRADHGSVPWSAVSPLEVALTQQTAPNVVYNGSGGLYTVVADVTGSGSVNLTFFAESDGTPYTGSSVLYQSQPSDQVGGVGAAYFAAYTGLAVDAQGRVYVAWTRNPAFTGGAMQDINVSTSLDHGRTWARIARASASNDLGQDENPLLEVGPDGRVWVAYEQFWGSAGNITFAVSSDLGATFQGHWNATGIPAGLTPEAYDFQVDSHGRLHLAYTACTASGVCSLFYTWSDDGSAWSSPKVLLDASPTGPSQYAYDPSLAIVGSTVNLDWLDSRLTATGAISMYYDRSTDRGATWATPVPISRGLSPPFFTGARLAAFGETVMSVWGASGGFAWALSATGGATWYPEQNQPTTPSLGAPAITVDANGTFHVAAIGDTTPSNSDLYQLYWDGPPDAPTGVSVTSPAAGSLALSWTAPPQRDVASYDVWMSPDGSTYGLAATVNAPTISWLDSGLANGTYWFKVTAVDATNHASHDSIPVAGTVGSSPANQSNALQQELNSTKAELSAIQGQMDQLRTAETVITLLLIVALIVLAFQTFLLVRQGRRPKKPAAVPPDLKPPEDEL